MSRKKRRQIPITLNLPNEPPTPAEIDAIIMTVDAIIGQVGRAGVVLVLNGSRSQKVYRWEWEKIAEYGALSYLTGPEIGSLVDWCIDQYWIDIEYTRDGIPLLFTTGKGWERTKGIWAKRVLGWFDEWIADGTPQNVWPRLEKMNQQIKHLVLEAIEEERRLQLVPILRSWFPHEVRKVRQAINRTLQTLGQRPLSHPPKQNRAIQ